MSVTTYGKELQAPVNSWSNTLLVSCQRGVDRSGVHNLHVNKHSFMGEHTAPDNLGGAARMFGTLTVSDASSKLDT